MYKFLVFFFLAALAAAPVRAEAWHGAAGHPTIAIWPNGAPGNPAHPEPESYSNVGALVAGRPVTRVHNVADPTITVYAPRQHASGAAVLIFPGGGYQILAMDLEGTEVAHWLNSLGITAFLVKYRVPDSGPYPKHSAALEDAQRAMGIVRSEAAKWEIDPDRIGVIGFSAGANLVVELSNDFETRIYRGIDAADNASCRPDFALVIYPAYLALPKQHFMFNPDIKINSQAPPTFLIQAEDDPVHVQNAIAYYLALHQAGIPAEMHLYTAGGHGYGLRPTALPITHWPQLAAAWLRTIGILGHTAK